jgi:homoserine O-acetyltransferase
MDEHRDRWWASPTTTLGRVEHLDLPRPFVAAHGGELPAIQVSYECWGSLNAKRDNAVLIVHPMTADCHVTGEFAGEPRGWWEDLVGPGRAIDTDRFFVVCPNLIGGCYGTTGPWALATDGAPYRDRFPLLTPLDMMRVQRRFLRQLRINRVHTVIGPSMGGMIAWEWAIEASEVADHVVVVAAPLRTSPHQIGLNWLQRRGIELDISENEVVARFGQMVARGVGMLSYRSPIGLEEKFGRDWFKEPGSTLRDRGMFNIESWLRHHGKRITKRFDPYTYLLYSRAMDLHDVAVERGDLIGALDRVTCKTLVVGISSDNLYPPAEVKLGADMLDHLGRDIRYSEIRSPNGHDAFLLDTDQIADILADFASAPSGVGRTESDLRTVRVGILGAGQVAASFIRLVRDRQEQLRTRHQLAVEIGVIAEVKRDKVLDPVFADLDVVYEPESLASRTDVDVVLDVTRGLGSLPVIEATLERGCPVVTSNKMLLRTYGDLLARMAYQRGVRIAYHDSIAAGWPLIYALERALTPEGVHGIRAVLSSAVNVMLESMEEGATLKESLTLAIGLDLTEPDPDLDVSGWDTAQKLSLLMARMTGRRYVGRDVETHELDTVDPELVRAAPTVGFRVKLVGVAQRDDSTLTAAVRPVAVPAESHLGMVRGTSNAVVVHAPDGGEMVYLGSGGGALPVATAVLNDLIGLFDADHSWTGRFPAVDSELLPARFERWLNFRRGAPEVGSEPAGGVPILDDLRIRKTMP